MFLVNVMRCDQVCLEFAHARCEGRSYHQAIPITFLRHHEANRLNETPTVWAIRLALEHTILFVMLGFNIYDIHAWEWCYVLSFLCRRTSPWAALRACDIVRRVRATCVLQRITQNNNDYNYSPAVWPMPSQARIGYSTGLKD